MTASTDTGSDVWVNDYTTSAGVHVAGHWRRRNTSSIDQGTEATPGTAGDSTEDLPVSGQGQPGRESTGTAAPVRQQVRSSSPRLAAAETRYRAAAVAAGLSALRHRGGGASSPELQAALQERKDAKAELEAAQAELEPDGTDGTGTDPTRQCPDCGRFRGSTHQCPVPAGLPDANYAGVKGDDRVKAMVADLETSVKAIVESGQLQRWLNAMASNGMLRWSANNRILAAVQLLQRGESLDNLHLMGFRQWEKLNRKVSKGAKAVWILAPITRKVVDEDEDGSQRERSRVVGFKGVPVFNVSDTHGEELASAPVRSAPGEATPGTVEGLRDRVAQAGYTYEEVEIPGCRPATGEGTLGYTDPRSKRIVVDSRLSPAQKASTIAHELGHVHCGHVDGDYSEYQRHRGQMETEAEMTAYLVNRHRGMSREQVEAFSPGYIAGWSRGDPAVMHKAVDKATKAFNKITDGPWPDHTEGR